MLLIVTFICNIHNILSTCELCYNLGRYCVIIAKAFVSVGHVIYVDLYITVYVQQDFDTLS